MTPTIGGASSITPFAHEDYIVECTRRFEERKYHDGRDKNSHMLHNSVESGHNQTSQWLEKDVVTISEGESFSGASFIKSKSQH